jgi:hypothetical protein
MLSRIVLWQTLLKEGIVSLSYETAVSKASFLRAGNVNAQPSQFSAYDCSLTGIVGLLEVIGQSGIHSLYVPTCKPKSWSLLISFIFAWCGVYSSLVRMISPWALCTQQGRQAVAGQHLRSLRRAVAVQWDAMISPIVESSPRRSFPTPVGGSF